MTELPKWAMDKAAAVHQQMAEAAYLARYSNKPAGPLLGGDA